MDIKTLSQSIGMSGFQVNAVLDKIIAFKEGDGEYGHYTFQNVILRDDTGKIACVIKNHPRIADNLTGQSVVIKPISARGELKGTVIKQETYEDDDGETKTITKLHVTKSAQIEIGQGVATQTQQQSSAKPSHNVDIETLLRETLKKAASIMTEPEIVACRDSIIASGWTTEDMRAIAITIAIQKSRR